MPSEKNKSRVVSFRLSGQQINAINELIKRTGASTEAKVFRNALRVYHKLVTDRRDRGITFLYTRVPLYEAFQDLTLIDLYDPFNPLANQDRV